MQDQGRPTPGIEGEDDRNFGPTRDGRWALGVLLILLGVIFFLIRSNILPAFNWPALFLLVPVLVLFSTAYQRFRLSGSALDRDVRVPFIIGAGLLLMMGMLLMQWDWHDVFWPALLIFAGFAGLLQALDRRSR